MDSHGTFTATLIETSEKALAAGAITRLSESGGAGDVEAYGFRQLAADAQMRLKALAEALAAGRPELMRMEVEWLATTYAARQVPLDFLRRSLACLRDELEDNLPAHSATAASTYLDEAIDGLPEDVPAMPSLLADGQPHVDLARRFLLAVLEGRRHDAHQLLLDAMEQGASVADLHRHVLAGTQAELGRMWQVGDATIAEEHLASRTVEEALTLLRARSPRVEPNGRKVLVASVQGNMHDIGARMVADHFEMAGWQAFLLGADTPADAVVSAISHFKADLVALSAGLGLNIRATAALVAAIREASPAVPVLVGGRPFSRLPDLWQTVEADGSAPDAEGAVAEGERLVAARS